MLSLAVSSLSYGGRTIVHTRGAVLPAAARRALVTALDGETDKSLYALGFNVGRQMGELKSLDGAELENQPTSDSANTCHGAHWDQRLFMNEFMAPVGTHGLQDVRRCEKDGLNGVKQEM